MSVPVHPLNVPDSVKLFAILARERLTKREREQLLEQIGQQMSLQGPNEAEPVEVVQLFTAAQLADAVPDLLLISAFTDALTLAGWAEV